MLKVEPHRVTIGCKSTFGFVEMPEFLAALAKRIKSNPASSKQYSGLHQAEPEPKELGSGGKLVTQVFYHHIQVHPGFGLHPVYSQAARSLEQGFKALIL